MDRLDEWQVFAAVAALRSFAAAARQLGRSPQAVTRAVAALEARIGVKLLHRTTRSVSLTSDGERYLEAARRAVAEFQALEAPRDSSVRGRVAITAPVLYGQLRVMPVVAELLAAYPEVDARVVLLDRVVALAEEGVDVGIRVGALPDSALRARPLGVVRSVLVASPAYLARGGTPRRPEALADHACIALTATTPIVERWAFPGERRERSVAVRPRLVVNTGQAAIDAALAGLGIVRVLSYQVDELVAQGRLRVVLAGHEPPPVPVQLVMLPGPLGRAAQAFAELAAKRLTAPRR